jgi:glycosyltransferase involved in cell wall biosynthesis
MGWGGQEIRVVQEMREFIRRGWRLRLACRAGSRIAVEASELGIPVHVLPFCNAWDGWTVIQLARLIRREKVELVHTHSSVDGWCGGMAARLAGVPVVRSRHLSSRVRAGLNARIVYDVLADRVISSGRHIREQLLEAGAGRPEKHVSVPAGADERRFHTQVDGRKVRDELGIGPGERIVGMVAVLRSWKGHEVFLRAARRLHETDASLKFWIVGEGPMRETITGWIEAWDMAAYVRMLGHRSDIPEVMKAMDVKVLPSLKNEATSQVLPQAMLVGTPVVSTSAGGLTEVVENGVRGWVVPPGDVDALVVALQRVFAEPERTRGMAEEARRFAREELTFQRQIERTQAVYDSLCNRNTAKDG